MSMDLVAELGLEPPTDRVDVWMWKHVLSPFSLCVHVNYWKIQLSVLCASSRTHYSCHKTNDETSFSSSLLFDTSIITLLQAFPQHHSLLRVLPI